MNFQSDDQASLVLCLRWISRRRSGLQRVGPVRRGGVGWLLARRMPCPRGARQVESNGFAVGYGFSSAHEACPFVVVFHLPTKDVVVFVVDVFSLITRT